MNPWQGDLSICVVSWRSHALLDRCLESLRQFGPIGESGPPLIVVVNEAQLADVTASGALAWFDTVILNRRNCGIEGAVSQALHSCRTPLMLRLDDDSHVRDPAWWGTLLDECRGCDPDVGALGRRHVFGCYGERPPWQGGISLPWVRRQPWCRMRNPRVTPQEQESIMSQPSVGVSGGFCVLNVEACREVGYPSDEYPHYEEDGIMSLQLRMNGWTLANSPMITDGVMVAVGDAPSRTERARRRQKWKGEYAEG